MNITDKSIQAYIRQAQKDITKKYVSYSIGNNLWLRVHTKTGNATWLYRVAMPDDNFKSGYKFTFETIGSYPAITLLQAKIKATQIAEVVKSGTNPLEVKKEQEKSKVTFKQIWEKWYAAADIKPLTKERQKSQYKIHLSKIADVPVETITDKLAFDIVIQPILDAGNKIQAKAILSKLKQITKFAYQSHIIESNPFTDRFVIPDNYIVKKKDRERKRTMSFDELTRFLLALEQAYSQNLIDIRYHHFFKLVILLGTRKAELANRKWEHYHNGVLKLTETKTGDDLDIKLPTQAIKLLDELAELRMNDYIFFGSRLNQTHFSIRSILDYFNKVTALANLDDLTVHDLRRTFCSRNSELGERYEYIEKAVNHRIQGTGATYHHSDLLEERFKMLQRWANHVDSITL